MFTALYVYLPPNKDAEIDSTEELCKLHSMFSVVK